MGEKHRPLLSLVRTRLCYGRRLGAADAGPSVDGRSCFVCMGAFGSPDERIAGDRFDTSASEYLGTDELLEVPMLVGNRHLAAQINGSFARPHRLSGRVGRSRSRRVPQIATQSRMRARASAKSRSQAIGAEALALLWWQLNQ